MNLVQAKISRWTEILCSLDKYGFLTTSQIQRLHGLGGRRNATRILNDMGDLLNSFQLDEKVFYLSAKGRKEIGSTIVRKRTLQTPHQLLRNDVFIHYRPEYWKPEFKISWSDKSIIPDAVFRHQDQYVFLEIDFTQTMSQNERKIALYRELHESGLFQKKYGHFPRIMFVTVTESRINKLQSLLDGLIHEVLNANDVR